MKGRILTATILSILIITSSAFAGQFGAPQPMPNENGFSLGVGYFYSQNDWEPKDNTTSVDYKVKRNEVYVQASGATKNVEGYLRLGGVNVNVKDGFGPGQDFNDSGKIFGTVGAKAYCPLKDNFGIGPFVQFSLYDTLRDSVSGVNVKISNGWELGTGIALQGSIGPIVIYAGPYLFWSKAGVEVLGVSEDVQAKQNFGGMGGIRFIISKEVSLEAEAQYTNELSAGGMIAFNF